MEQESDSAARILKTLRFRPRGMTISEIAKQTHITRNSVSKHLEVLRMGGQVDMRSVGNAKVYSVAQRVPMSAFLCFTKNLIVVLDSNGTVVQINDHLLRLAGVKKDEIIGENIRDVPIPMLSTAEMIAFIEGVEREQFITDVCHTHNNEDFFYQMQVIPTVFEDGERGRTIVLEDITEKKRYVENMEFLAKTAMEFVDLPDRTDIYQRIAELLLEFIPEGRVFVQSYDEIRRHFAVRAVMGQDFRDALTSHIGRDPVGMVFPLDEVFLSPLLANPDEIKRGIREIRLAAKAGEDRLSFYDFTFRQIPETVCEEILHRQNIGKVYLAFFAWNEQLLGDVGVFMSKENSLTDTRVLESFIRQASIVISRRMTEERLRRSNHRFREVVEISPFAAAIIDPEGCYTYINHSFTDLFGYTLADIPTGRDWFEKAFPDEELRARAIATWKSDLNTAGKNQARPRTFPVRCKNGETRAILFRPVTLCDNTQFIIYEDVTELRQAHRVLLSGISELMDVKEELKVRGQVLDALPCAVGIADVNGNLKYVNPAFLSLWGYDSVEEVAGKHASEFLKGSAVAKNGIPVLDKRQQWSGPLSGIRKDQSTFTGQVTVTAITDTNGQVIGLVGSFKGSDSLQ
ncbi:PAS domain S-box protein [Methanogenium sp. S4BF]|uniref:PAS domain S-box protein n=1 Tax=Methanogenium sp. S4BF TaxID=1789226 RepID=UPI002417C637|nr:PAS domain S-box protein [Methanogenium sp. S4BF]WFN35638.1 PAS domain S-box protein [Methanogenium sp. S4BF]